MFACRCRLGLVLSVGGLWAAVARAEAPLTGTGEVTAGAGYDTNMLLQFAPDAAQAATGGASPVRGWFGRVAPFLEGAFAPAGWRLEASYSGDVRDTGAAGWLQFHELELGLAFPQVGPVRFFVGGSAGRFDIGDDAADRFVAAGGDGGLRWQITEGLRALLSYRLELRDFTARAAGEGESDLSHAGEVRLAYRPSSRLEVAWSGTYLDMAPLASSNASAAGFRRARGAVEWSLVWGRLSLTGGVSLARLQVPSVLTDWQAGVTVGARVKVTAAVDVAALADWTGSIGGAGEPAFERRLVTVGLVAHATLRRTPIPAESAPDVRPRVERGRVRLRLRAGQAGAVAVIGSWNDWAPRGTPLSRTAEGGLWEAWVPLPPGRHRYHFLVDGEAARPPDAPGYAPDGFGGEDGVLEVPAAARAPGVIAP